MLFRLNLYQYVKFSLYFTSLYFFHIRQILLVFFIYFLFIFLSLMNLDTHEWLMINNLNQDIMILFILFSFKSTIKKNINCSQQREHYLKSVQSHFAVSNSCKHIYITSSISMSNEQWTWIRPREDMRSSAMVDLKQFLYPPQRSCRGYTGFTMSVRPSVCRQILCRTMT